MRRRLRCSTCSWCRNAKTSSWSAARERAHVRRVSAKDRSTDIMPRSVSIVGRNINGRNKNGLFSNHRVEFANGVIEAEIAGAPAPGAPETARGFVGIAFRVQNDMRTFECLYLRPTNGRADDQERRNHAVQYSSNPDWPFVRTRKETPSKYEAYVDLLPGVWTKVRIEVRDARARLYVHDQEQPT